MERVQVEPGHFWFSVQSTECVIAVFTVTSLKEGYEDESCLCLKWVDPSSQFYVLYLASV